jgi:hypothetical protein
MAEISELNPPYTIFAPAPTKARIENVARASGRTITALVEQFAEHAEQAMLKKLTPPQQKVYLQDQLLFADAFPRKRRMKQRDWPLPEGERVPITIRASKKTIGQLRRYCNLLNCPASYILEKLGINGEKMFLAKLSSDEKREAFKAGKFRFQSTGHGKWKLIFDLPHEPNAPADPPPESPIDPLADDNGDST